MALARTRSVALVGVSGHMVEVEADLAAGLPGLTIVGLPDTALEEAPARVRAAMQNSGHPWPQRRITLGLFPASLPKGGSAFDLAAAAAILVATGVGSAERLARMVLVGELGLDGTVRPIRGVLPAVLAATRAGADEIVVPTANLAEALMVPGAPAVGVASLRHLLDVLEGKAVPDETPPARSARDSDDHSRTGNARVDDELDMADVLGQSDARRALEVSAAGGHHVFVVGPPGAGKTMLARRLPTILPDLAGSEALETTAVHSVAGMLPDACPLVTRPPLRDPHHSASVPALVGGGSGHARPGEVSLAHNGILFLDEAPEFNRGVLDALRQPLESGHVSLARSGGSVSYPAAFTLVLAANPCPCGGPIDCVCPATARRRYLGRLSGPLMDRIDLHLTVHAPAQADMLADGPGAESSAVVRARVTQARDRQQARLARHGLRLNSQVSGRLLRRELAPSPDARRFIRDAFSRGQLTARGVDRVLRTAWSIADLAGTERPSLDEVAEAHSLRMGGPR